MRRILLDTNAYVAFKRGDEDALTFVRRAKVVGVSTVVLGELLCGFAAGNREAQNRDELLAFLDSPRVDVFPVNQDTADVYARVYFSLRRKGRPIPSNDLWIAATALQHGLGLFTYDRHFGEVDGLVVGSRPSDFLL